jgi:hypothetical protein
MIENLSVYGKMIAWVDTGEGLNIVHIKPANESASADAIVICVETQNNNTLDYMSSVFTEKYGIEVQIKEYLEVGKIKLKLMANDSDFDMYFPAYAAVNEYINASVYVNLLEFPEIKEAVKEKEELISFLSVHNGEMFAVPFNLSIKDEEIRSPDFASNLARQRKYKNTTTYLLSTLNLLDGTYTDESGEELTEMLNYAVDNQNDDFAGSYIEEYDYIDCEFMFMNPFSKNKELAALFLASTLTCSPAELKSTIATMIRKIISLQESGLCTPVMKTSILQVSNLSISLLEWIRL